mmetsp:Transcript_15904/g.33670  ORF Transcript_15904/g.33670 Transcript_15904/m.33670 type:complete len:326 (+) Transcript_15904:301-1278(+)
MKPAVSLLDLLDPGTSLQKPQLACLPSLILPHYDAEAATANNNPSSRCGGISSVSDGLRSPCLCGLVVRTTIVFAGSSLCGLWHLRPGLQTLKLLTLADPIRRDGVHSLRHGCQEVQSRSVLALLFLALSFGSLPLTPLPLPFPPRSVLGFPLTARALPLSLLPLLCLVIGILLPIGNAVVVWQLTEAELKCPQHSRHWCRRVLATIRIHCLDRRRLLAEVSEAICADTPELVCTQFPQAWQLCQILQAPVREARCRADAQVNEALAVLLAESGHLCIPQVEATGAYHFQSRAECSVGAEVVYEAGVEALAIAQVQRAKAAATVN